MCVYVVRVDVLLLLVVVMLNSHGHFGVAAFMFVGLLQHNCFLVSLLFFRFCFFFRSLHYSHMLTRLQQQQQQQWHISLSLLFGACPGFLWAVTTTIIIIIVVDSERANERQLQALTLISTFSFYFM